MDKPVCESILDRLYCRVFSDTVRIAGTEVLRPERRSRRLRSLAVSESNGLARCRPQDLSRSVERKCAHTSELLPGLGSAEWMLRRFWLLCVSHSTSHFHTAHQTVPRGLVFASNGFAVCASCLSTLVAAGAAFACPQAFGQLARWAMARLLPCCPGSRMWSVPNLSNREVCRRLPDSVFIHTYSRLKAVGVRGVVRGGYPSGFLRRTFAVPGL